MAWVKIDDHFYDDPRWADAPGESIALWLASIAWCNRNDSRDGFIPEHKTRGLLAIKNTPKTCADLVRRGGFIEVTNGFLIKSYAKYQQPEKVQELHDKRSASGKRGAAARWGEKARAAEVAAAPPPPEPPPEEWQVAIDVAMSDAIKDASGFVTEEKCPVTRYPLPDPVTSAAATYVSSPEARAAAALELFVQHRIRAKSPHNPGGFARSLRRDERRDKAEPLARYLDQHPTATVDEIAQHVYGLGPIDLIALGHTPTRNAP